MSPIPVRLDSTDCQRKSHSLHLDNTAPERPMHTSKVEPLPLVQLAHEASKEAEPKKRCHRQLDVQLQVALMLTAPWALRWAVYAAPRVLPETPDCNTS